MEDKNKMKNEILEQIAGLKEHLERRGVEGKYEITALARDEESNTAAYALLSKPSPSEYLDHVVLGIYSEGRFLEAKLNSWPIKRVTLRKWNPGSWHLYVWHGDRAWDGTEKTGCWEFPESGFKKSE